MCWNCEVNPLRCMDTRSRGRRAAQEGMPQVWLQLARMSSYAMLRCFTLTASGLNHGGLSTLFATKPSPLLKAVRAFRPSWHDGTRRSRMAPGCRELEKSEIFNKEQTDNLYYHLSYLSDKAEQSWMDLAATAESKMGTTVYGLLRRV